MKAIINQKTFDRIKNHGFLALNIGGVSHTLVLTNGAAKTPKETDVVFSSPEVKDIFETQKTLLRDAPNGRAIFENFNELQAAFLKGEMKGATAVHLNMENALLSKGSEFERVETDEEKVARLAKETKVKDAEKAAMRAELLAEIEAEKAKEIADEKATEKPKVGRPKKS